MEVAKEINQEEAAKCIEQEESERVRIGGVQTGGEGKTAILFVSRACHQDAATL